jgi:hypothetical protein
MLTEEERFSIAEAAADADDDCLPTRAETLRSLLARSYAGEWIAVGERLPERNGNEMVMLFNGNLITFGSRSGDGWYVAEAAELLGPTSLDRFTHWMPLPPPPVR